MPKKPDSNQLDTDSEMFLKLGGHPVLDFVNTKAIHASSTEDRLTRPDHVRLFFKDAFQVSCTSTPRDFKETIEIRQIFREFFESLITKSISNSAILRINDFLSKLSFCPEVFVLSSGNIGNTWKSTKKESVQVSTLVLQFLGFVSMAELSRLKKCSNPNCSHLFYDSSRNNTRNWCSMKSCGNIMKAREFYKRSKKKQSEQG